MLQQNFSDNQDSLSQSSQPQNSQRPKEKTVIRKNVDQLHKNPLKQQKKGSSHSSPQLLLIYLLYKGQKLSLFLHKGITYEELTDRLLKEIYLFEKETFSQSNLIIRSVMRKIIGFRSIDGEIILGCWALEEAKDQSKNSSNNENEEISSIEQEKTKILSSQKFFQPCFKEQQQQPKQKSSQRQQRSQITSSNPLSFSPTGAPQNYRQKIQAIISQYNSHHQSGQYLSTTKQNNVASIEFYLQKSEHKLKRKMLGKIQHKYGRILHQQKQNTLKLNQTYFLPKKSAIIQKLNNENTPSLAIMKPRGKGGSNCGGLMMEKIYSSNISDSSLILKSSQLNRNNSRIQQNHESMILAQKQYATYLEEAENQYNKIKVYKQENSKKKKQTNKLTVCSTSSSKKTHRLNKHQSCNNGIKKSLYYRSEKVNTEKSCIESQGFRL